MFHPPVDQAFPREPLTEKDPIRSIIERRVPWATHDENFSQQSSGVGPWPDQGWKLHVSATPPSAIEVLNAALDVLLAAGARFKVVNSMSLLGALNSGLSGISQIGKFITVYPCDDAHAVRLARCVLAVSFITGTAPWCAGRSRARPAKPIATTTCSIPRVA
jgi:hypothetical protein